MQTQSSERWRERCLICGSSGLSVLIGYERAHLVRCRDCDMVFAARIPADSELAAHYHDYGHAWHDSAITRRRYRDVLDALEPHRSTNRILDVGCGAGYFLEEARSRGWEVHGTEYSGLALKLARGNRLNVLQAPIRIGRYESNTFDVVTAFEVFEHLSDPITEAALVADVLREGGVLYLTVPNFDALSRRVLGPRWSVIDYPEHLCYFTPNTLRSWLGRFGFVPESTATTGISLARLRHVHHGSSADMALDNSSDEQLRHMIERSRLLGWGKALANAGLSGLGAGDTLKARFRLGGRPAHNTR